LLESIVATPEQRLGELSLLTPQQRHQILSTFNATQMPLPQQSLVTLLAQQAQQRPDAIALLAEDQQLSYQALHQQSQVLAARLRHLGVGPDVVVGVCLPRTCLLPLALLAVLDAGGAYLPLDPSHPPERLAWLLTHAQAQVLLTCPSVLEDLAPQAVSVPHQLLVPDLIGNREPTPSALPFPALPAAGLACAYVIYTSGSTGEPKGVQVPELALRNLLLAFQHSLHLGPAHSWLAVTTVSFDIAALELFLPLLCGARLVLASSQQAHDGMALLQCLQQQAITHMQATPATWRLLEAAGWSASAELTVLCGGEGLPWELAQRLRQRVSRLYNVYGPTETTIWSTIEEVHLPAAQLQGLVPIGRPLTNTQVYVLDERLLPVVPGAEGEIYLGGLGLAHGYVQDPQQTAERFVPDPLSGRAGARLYRSGDRGRWTQGGRLAFVGRRDRQVKLRGYRIELGEIESVLRHSEAVGEAVVVLQAAQADDQRLVAYVEARPGAVLSVDELRQRLQERLPGYMQPGVLLPLERLPRLANGKINWRQLPSPVGMVVQRQPEQRPATGVEEVLRGIWQGVLALEQPVGLTENFFTLGGHSLLATQVISRIRAIFHVDISLHDFFKTPTIAALALFIEESSGTKKEEEYIETTHVDINQLTTEEIDTLLSHLLQSYGDLEP